MLAVPGTEAAVDGSEWIHEFKWDGIRVLLAADDHGHRLVTRNGNDAAVAWPELDPLAEALPAGTVLDGEVVVLDENLRPEFSRVAHRMHVRNPVRVSGLRSSLPGQLMLFDLLQVAGEWVIDEDLATRRERLATVVPDGPSWAVPPTVDDLTTILAVVDQRGFEGVVSKRRGSVYRPGVRSRDWRKLRRVREVDAVVVGHRGVDGSPRGPVGSLALARWVPAQDHWAPVGSVGSGLTTREGTRLRVRLDDLVIARPVVEIPVGFTPVTPEVVVRVSYLEATPQGQLRHPVYRGERPDALPTDVVDIP